MALLSICLFGKLCVESGARELSGFDSGKVQELLSYLLLHRDRPHPRETLAGVLWGDAPGEKSKKYLRHALWQLQTALETPRAKMEAEMFVVGHERVQLNLPAGVWFDVAALEEAYARVKGRAGVDLDEPCAELLQQAVQLYRGDLLEGWYQDWCLYERERLQNMYLVMLDKLVSYCLARQKYELGLLYGSLVLRYDRASERAHRQLMRLRYLSGDRTGALRQYQRCVAALEEELSVKPDKRTSALYQQIRADAYEPAAPAPAAPARPEEPAPPATLSELVGRIGHIQTLLTDLQRRVYNHLKAADPPLDKTH